MVDISVPGANGTQNHSHRSVDGSRESGRNKAGKSSAERAGCSFHANLTEAMRKVEVEFVHGRPGGPVRMRVILSAFEKVSAPDLAGHFAERADEFLQHGEWDGELQSPRQWFGDFGFDDARQGATHADGERRFRRNASELLETVRGARGISDVIAQERAATVEL